MWPRLVVECAASVQVFPLTYGFSESVEKPCLITMVTTPPPSQRLLKRGLVYHLCSRLNNMSVIRIRTSPAHLLLVQQIAPGLTPTLLFPDYLLPAAPPLEAHCE